MYPLSVTLVGCHDSVQRNVLSLLINQQASLEGQYPDAESAVAALRDAAPAVRLFITHVPTSQDLPGLRLLTTQFVGQPVVAIVDPQLDPGVLIAAMRAGAAQVVPSPIGAEDFQAALECIARQFGHATSVNQAVAVSGVTGGCGATALAVNLAYELASQHGQSVILSEMSLQLGKLAAYLDVNPGQTIYDLLTDSDQITSQTVQKALTRVSDRFDILAGEYRQITQLTAKASDLIRLVDVCRGLANFAVFDVPCTYDDNYFETVAAADQIILVGEQKIPSIRTLKLACEALERVDGLKKLHIVINRYDARMPGFGADRLRNLLGRGELLTVANDYGSVMASINHGRPLRQESPRSPALVDVEKLARTVLNLGDAPGVPVPPPVRGAEPLFGRLIRRFGFAN
jgi:pilus assembly protein CpaE